MRASETHQRAAKQRARAAEHRVMAAEDRLLAERDREQAARERRRLAGDREMSVVELQRERKLRDEALGHQQRAEQLARTLQRSLSPPGLPSIVGLEVAVHYEASAPEDVGGDFYDQEAGMTGTPATRPAPSLDGSESAAISNLTVRLLSQYTGRGPTKARTYIQDDIVTVVLRDTLTKGEVTLVNSNHARSCSRRDTPFRRSWAPSWSGAFEQITQRTVLAFLSANHIAPDIAVETFILVPTDDDALPASAGDGARAPASNGRDGA